MHSVKRTFSFLLAILMVFSMLPVQAFAVEEENSETSTENVEAEEQVKTVAENTLTDSASVAGVSITYSASGAFRFSNGTWTYLRANSGGESAVPDQIVVSNDTENQTVEFSYAGQYSFADLTIGGESATSPGTYLLYPGENATVTIEFSIPAGSSAGIALSGFQFTEIQASGVAFDYDANLGSITVGGTKVDPGYREEVSTDGVQVIAAPKTGTTFLGWINADTGAVLSTSATFTYKPFGEKTIKAAFAEDNSTAWFYAGGTSYLFDDLNSAVGHAESANNKTVVLAASGILPSGDYEISSTVTLLIPYDASHTLDADAKPTFTAPKREYVLFIPNKATFTQKPISESVAFRTLCMKRGAKITVAGKLNVNSEVFSIGVQDTGNPHGSYGLMILEAGAEINVVANGYLYCYGYIIGTYDDVGNYTGGKVTAASQANVYETFQIRDMRGSEALSAETDCFPLTQYYVQNIEAKYEISTGAFSSVALTASALLTDGQADFVFIGKDVGLFRLTSGKLTRLYHPIADRVEYTLTENGSMSLDELTIDIDGFDKMRSSDYYLGINGNITVTLESGSATINQKIKLLPGAEINVSENSTLTVVSGGALFLYDSEDWNTSFVKYASESNAGIATSGTTPLYPNNAGTKANVVRFSPSRQIVKGTITAANHGSAKLHVDGTLIANGNVYSTAGYTAPGGSLKQAGTYDNMLTGTGVYINYADYGAVTLKEYYNNSASNFATVNTQPLLGNILTDGVATVKSFSDPAENEATFYGAYMDANANGKQEASENIWTEGTINNVTVKLMHNGSEVGSWTMSVYEGADMTGYFTDDTCTTAATDTFTGDTLYAKATASITRGDETLYFQNPNIAVLNAQSGDTVKLISDVTIKTGIVVEAGQNLTLDLNNHKITAAGNVITNYGTLDILGGVIGEGTTPGALIDTAAGTTAINNHGTIGTIGGNLLISAPSGDGMRLHAGTVGTIGGDGSNVTVEVRDYLVVVGETAEITTIGGTNGTVTMVQNNNGGAVIRPFYVNGAVGTIGGTNANVTIKQINHINGLTATVFLESGGYITNIGGENATVNIVEDDQCTTAGTFRIAIWLNNGHIGTLGNGGTVNVISNKIGVYFGGSSNNNCYIEKVATTGTVNITGPVEDNVQTACTTAIYINTNVSKNDIGILGAGGTVNINASQCGVLLNAASADIGTIGLGGTVEINSVQEAIKVASGASITTLGGKDSHVIITQRTGENINLRTIHNFGTIGTIGGENAVVEITQHYEYTKGGSGNNPEVLTTSGTINLIGDTNATVLLKQNVASGSGFGLRVNGGGVIGKIGGDAKRVEIVSPDIPVYLAASGKIGEIAANTLFVRTTSYSQSVFWNTGTIEKITGGWFYSYNNSAEDIFRKGVNAVSGANAAKSALYSIQDGYGLLADKTVSIDSEAMEKAYACYSVVPVSEIDAEARIGSAYYAALKTADDKVKSGETLTLLKDVEYTGPGLVIPATALDFTLDLNNHSITAESYVILNRGRMNITGGAMTDANGNALPAGKLITKGTSDISSCIYTQLSDSGETFVGEIGTIGGNLELIDEAGKGKAAIFISGSSIDQIGTDGSKIKITTPGKALEVSSGATLNILGGAGSHIEMIQSESATLPAINVAGTITNIGYGEDSLVEITSAAISIYVASGATIGALGGENSTVVISQNLGTTNGCAYVLDVYGTINHIGDKNATVKLTQISNASQDKDNGNAKLIYVHGTINNIGTQSDSKVLVDQTVKSSGDCGWGLYVTGTVGTIGSKDSLVEIIADHSPVYLGGTLNTITGNTLMVGKRDYSTSSNAFWMATNKTVGSITGGYFAQGGVTVGSGYVDYIFDANNQKKIPGTTDAPTGYMLSETTIKRYSETTGKTYDCLYVCADHEHSSTQTPVVEWITEDGQVVLQATAPCDHSGCHEQVVVKSVATVSDKIEGDTYKLIYTATVTIGGQSYTENKTDTMQYAGKKTMKYDDRLFGEDIRILDAGEPTSKKVGTNELDDAVLTAYDNMLVATGIGEARVAIDGKVYDVTVEKAIIDLFMITGHSVGMGSKGNPDESVLINDGSAYSFTVTNNLPAGNYSYTYTDLIGNTEGVGLGYAAAVRPPEVDNFTAAGGGVIGEDSGLAWKWNKLTGHKVYVVNSAVGSTSMYHWYIDKSNSENPVSILTNAIHNFTAARAIIQNEVDAGHFEMGVMTMINHSSANYSDSWGAIRQTYNDTDGQVWFEKVLGDITTAMNIDWDQNSTVEAGSETMSIGFVPIWSRPDNNTSTAISMGFGTDKPVVLYMGASDSYPDRFVASLVGRELWGTDEKVAAYFKDYVQEYTAQNGEKLPIPTTNLELYPYEIGDYVHYDQFAYNEMGIDVAKNVYAKLYGNTGTVSLKLLNTDGKTEVAANGAEHLNLTAGSSLKLVPIVDPVSVSDLTFTAEGSLGIKWPLVIYAKGTGEGSLTISYKGNVLKTITIDIEAVAQVGDTTYMDLTEAIQNVPANGTVTLLKDIELSSGITVADDRDFTLNLNNHSITVAGTALTNYGTLNILGGETGEDQTAGALISTAGTAVVNYGHIGTIDGNLMIDAKNAAIHVNHADARIDLIGGENAAITMNAAGNNAIYLQSGTIGTIGATGTGLVTINATNRGILIVSTTPNPDGYALEAITGNVTLNSHGATLYIMSGSRVGAVGGNGTITINRETATWDSAENDAAIYVTSGHIEAIGGAGGTVNITSVKAGIQLNAGSVGTIGAGGTVTVNSVGYALYLKAVGTTVGTLGGTNSEVTMISSGSYTVNINGGHIGTIGGTNAKVNLFCDDSTGNTVVLNVSNTASGTIGTIGGENAEIILLQRGATTGIQYGILLNGTDTKTAQIEKIGAGAKFVEVIVDDCPVYLDSESEILAIEDNVLLVARTVSAKSNSKYVFNGTSANVTINGGKFSRGNSNDITVVLAEANREGKTFTENTVDVVANADGKTYKCFIVHDHSYTATVTKPTCTEAGYTTYTCECGDTYTTDVVDALGHTEVIDASVEATCTETGLTEGKHCSVCGEVLVKQEVVDALNHSFTNYVSNEDATCIADGTKTAKCENCDATDTITDEGTKKADHSWVLDGTNPYTGSYEYGEDGKCVYTFQAHAKCTTEGCDKTLSIDYTAITGKEVVAPATCSEYGTANLTVTFDTEKYPWVEAEHTFNNFHIDKDPSTHTYGTGIVTPPSCESDGYTTYICTNCDASYTDNTVEKLGHASAEAVEENRKESTCTVAGSYESVVYCSACKTELIRETKALELAAHTEGAVVVENNVAPTCTAEGSYDNVVYCTVCNAELSRNTVTVDKIAHAYEAVVTAPTCTAKGYTTYTCSACGDSYVADETEMVAHSPAAAVEENRVESTCTVAGSYDEVVCCSACNTELSRETKALELAEHTEVVDEAKAPTCTETGLTEGEHCSVCGEVLVAQTVVAALGHKEETSYTPAENAKHMVKTTCSVCSNVTSETEEPCADEDGDNKCDKCSGAMICEHNWDEGAVTTEPTCKDEGVKTYNCTNCGATKTESVEATGKHSWKEGTCEVCQTTCGHTMVNGVCTNCGYQAEVVTKPAIELYQRSLILEELVAVKYTFTINTAEYDEEYIKTNSGLLVWMEDNIFDGQKYESGTESYRVVGLKKNGSFYEAEAHGVAAKCMGDTMYAVGYIINKNGEYEYTDIIDFNPVKYAQGALSMTAPAWVKLHPLMVAMMNYGAAAQVQFNYKTERLMNAWLTTDQLALVSYQDSYIKELKTDTSKYTITPDITLTTCSRSLVLENNVWIRFTLNFNKALMENAQEVKLLYWSEAQYNSVTTCTRENVSGASALKANGSLYDADISGIAAKHMGNTYYVCLYIKDANGVEHYSDMRTFSIHFYCDYFIGGSDLKLGELCKWIVTYSYEARKYFPN